MQRISTSTAVATRPAASTGGTPGYFTDGNAASGLAGTVVDDDFLNGIQEVIANPIEATGQTLSAQDDAQLTAAIRKLALTARYDSVFAKKVGGYNWGAIVADPNTTGLFWVSTSDNNLSAPGNSGAAWVNLFASQYNTGRFLNSRTITSSQTYTVPAGVYKIRVRLQAAGGAGGGSADNTNGSGASCASSGGSGAYVEAVFPVTPGQQIPISIGIGGVGVTAKNGGTGGATTLGPFGSFAALSCPGGLGGYAGLQTSSTSATAIPGCPSNGPPTGPNIVYAVGSSGGFQGYAFLGAAAAPPGAGSTMGAGGTGITGYSTGGSQPGGNAQGWGGGGGAHANQQGAQNAGGAGGSGFCVIDEFSG